VPPGQPEPAEILDHELTRILAIHGPELEETSRILLATGAATIARPEVILRVRLRVPSRWRRGLLEIAAEDPASGAALARSASTLRRSGQDSAALRQEITIDLAMELAYGRYRAGPRSGR
jgi:hypothetical protein